jgi:hypothetical protein
MNYQKVSKTYHIHGRNGKDASIIDLREALYSNNERTSILKGVLTPLLNFDQPDGFIPLKNGCGLLTNNLPRITINGKKQDVEDVKKRLENSLNVLLKEGKNGN